MQYCCEITSYRHTSTTRRQTIVLLKLHGKQNNIFTKPTRSYGILERGNNCHTIVNHLHLNTESSFTLSFYPNNILQNLTLYNHFLYFVEDCFVLIDNIASYSGTISTTMTGKTCQRWDVILPHAPVYTLGPEHANYCRAPDNDTRVWCMTTNITTPWEYCDISECGK